MIVKTKFKDLFIFKNKSFIDKRGHFKELVKEKVIKKKLPFTVMSFSKKNVIRGLHIQTKNSQGKFISVLKGKIYDVALDLRKNSKTFGKVFKCILSEANSNSLYIPEGFAHGYIVKSERSIVVYKCTNYYDKNDEFGIKWNDSSLNLNWRCSNPIISDKDKSLPFLDEQKNLPEY